MLVALALQRGSVLLQVLELARLACAAPLRTLAVRLTPACSVLTGITCRRAAQNRERM